MGQDRRLEFQDVLEQTSGLASEHVYFQPPPNTEMFYPCIVYERDNASFKSADNRTAYIFVQRYQVTYISRDPDGDVIDKLAALPLSSYNRGFQTSGLNHDVFTIYY